MTAAELEALLKAATPGPWVAWGPAREEYPKGDSRRSPLVTTERGVKTIPLIEEDGELIVELRAAGPQLVAALRLAEWAATPEAFSSAAVAEGARLVADYCEARGA